MSDSTIKAIETSYAGCRFRSRLEARWAVFFDTLGIAWEYEAQGYECTRRLGLSGPQHETFRYLPDFWLPDHQLYAEVKGSLTELETVRLLDAAAHLSAPAGGCGDTDVVVLGPVPRAPGLPSALHLHKGLLELDLWYPPFAPARCGRGLAIADDESGWAARWGAARAARELLRGVTLDAAALLQPGATELNAAYTAARSARFEHGESGASGRGAQQ